MQLLNWNCNGALRKKFQHLTHFDADIYIIQECEDPATSKDSNYILWAENYLWIGDSKNKGIGIFAKNGYTLKKLDWCNRYHDHTVKHFLPCRVNDSFDILALWLHQNNSPTFGYIGQLWKYLQINKRHMTKSLIIGDFNSNVRWDTWDRWWNHSDVVEELNGMGIVSLYHRYFNEEQGRETKSTFYLHRNIVKQYHIDYCFAPSKMAEQLVYLSIGNFEDWITFSDHLPMYLKFGDAY